MPLAQTDAFQKVYCLSITGADGYRKLVDPEFGNTVLYLEMGSSNTERKIRIAYEVLRKEKSSYDSGSEDVSKYLSPANKIPIDGDILKTAKEIVAGKTSDLERTRALYDHVMDQMAYKKCGTGWGEGDAERVCRLPSGNCTDYHSYFIGLCRAVGIPARFAIGAAIPSERDEGGTDGYHCWAEFLADGKWWPVDISEADKFTGLSMYYFGHHPANRLEFSRGRDIMLTPGPKSGPINFLAYPVVEIDGRETSVKTLFGFRRL
jgi:transglutaminase-like putative cysteine protease